tara:strand:+ start:13 stop:369 length:357 start_codon:yes stop_codon:yes gene_type:complete
MRKLISAILFSSDVELSKEERITLSGKIEDAIKSQYDYKHKTQREPLNNGANTREHNTAVVRLTQEELYTCAMELEDKSLSIFFGGLSNQLQQMEEERQREEMANRGVDFCEPGVNCE